MKDQIMWAIRAPVYGGLEAWVWDVRRTRQDSIKEFSGTTNTREKWRSWYRKGYRAVKVRVQVII
jgi:hypothetical protein